jgi:hypothetical protein
MLRNMGGFSIWGLTGCRFTSVQTTKQMNNLFHTVCQIIAPVLASERMECLCDPDWNGDRNQWLSTCGVAEELLSVTNDDDLVDAWDNLTYGEQRMMLSDSLIHFDDCGYRV